MSERKSGTISGHSVRLYGSFLFTQETRNIWQNKYAVITCDKVINICLLILKCLLSSIYQIWVGLEYKPNKGTQLDHHDNKTQCQPCKRLAWPIIPQSWSGLAWKSVSPMDVITLGQSTTIFLCIRPFSMRTKQPTKQQGDPSASLLLTSENAVYCNCDHIGFYGQYGKKLPAMMITDAYGLHQQPLSMSLSFISLTLQMLAFVFVFVFYILDLSSDAGRLYRQPLHPHPRVNPLPVHSLPQQGFCLHQHGNSHHDHRKTLFIRCLQPIIQAQNP